MRETIMSNRIPKGLLAIIPIILLASCSSKHARPPTAQVSTVPQYSTPSSRPYSLYSEDDTRLNYGNGRSSDVFPKPSALEPQVAFWKKVYSGWSRSQVAVHDKVHMGLIYEVFDLPDEGTTTLTQNQKDYIQQQFEGWRVRLAELEDKTASGQPLSQGERELARHIERATGSLSAIEGSSQRLRYQRGMRERFRKGLLIGRKYDHEFRSIFREAGLPEDLAYLPHVESSFQYNARSSAGALGIWQFTAGAARMFMNGDSSAESRLDPIASTRGAARYLSYAYDKLGSWPLAVTSYNHGIGGMQRAKDRFGHDFMRIVKHYDHPQFGFASRNYYAEFLAARDIAAEPERYFPEGVDSDFSGDTSPSGRVVGYSQAQPAEPTPYQSAENASPSPPEAEKSVYVPPVEPAEPQPAGNTPAPPLDTEETALAPPAEPADPQPVGNVPAPPLDTQETALAPPAEPAEPQPAEPQPQLALNATDTPLEADEADDAEPTEPQQAHRSVAKAKTPSIVPVKPAKPQPYQPTVKVGNSRLETEKAAFVATAKPANPQAKKSASLDPKKAERVFLPVGHQQMAKPPRLAESTKTGRASASASTLVAAKPALKSQPSIAKSANLAESGAKNHGGQKSAVTKENEKKNAEKIRLAKR